MKTTSADNISVSRLWYAISSSRPDNVRTPVAKLVDSPPEDLLGQQGTSGSLPSAFTTAIATARALATRLGCSFAELQLRANLAALTRAQFDTTSDSLSKTLTGAELRLVIEHGYFDYGRVVGKLGPELAERFGGLLDKPNAVANAVLFTTATTKQPKDIRPVLQDIVDGRLHARSDEVLVGAARVALAALDSEAKMGALRDMISHAPSDSDMIRAWNSNQKLTPELAKLARTEHGLRAILVARDSGRLISHTREELNRLLALVAAEAMDNNDEATLAALYGAGVGEQLMKCLIQTERWELGSHRPLWARIELKAHCLLMGAKLLAKEASADPAKCAGAAALMTEFGVRFSYTGSGFDYPKTQVAIAEIAAEMLEAHGQDGAKMRSAAAQAIKSYQLATGAGSSRR